MVNMPISRFTVGAMPKTAKASSITSVSEVPRNATPRAASSARNSWKLKISPLNVTTRRPSADNIGWCPVGDRSRMARRRCASATPASASLQTPWSSGPRCARLSPMACAPRSISRVAPSVRKTPAMPHMATV